MAIPKKYPPLLLKYLKMFQEDPKSKIFAPLAECYRKMGLLNEAVEICLEGIEANPDYVGGKVALARAYSDQKKFSLVYDILKPAIDTIPDNILAQRLFSNACLAIGRIGESLTALKLLLYFNPEDKEIESLVRDIETQSIENGGLIRLGNNPQHFRRLVLLQKLLTRVQDYRKRMVDNSIFQ